MPETDNIRIWRENGVPMSWWRRHHGDQNGSWCCRKKSWLAISGTNERSRVSMTWRDDASMSRMWDCLDEWLPGWGIARMGDCPYVGLPGWGIARMGDCPDGGLPVCGIAQMGDCPDVGLPGWGIARMRDCPDGGLPGWGIARMWDCPDGGLPGCGIARMRDCPGVGLPGWGFVFYRSLIVSAVDGFGKKRFGIGDSAIRGICLSPGLLWGNNEMCIIF